MSREDMKAIRRARNSLSQANIMQATINTAAVLLAGMALRS
jgi:hypothetical protein